MCVRRPTFTCLIVAFVGGGVVKCKKEVCPGYICVCKPAKAVAGTGLHREGCTDRRQRRDRRETNILEPS